MSWLLFLFRALLFALVLFVPGLVCLARLRIPNHLLVAISPTFSIVMLTLAFALLYQFQIPSDWPLYLALFSAVTLIGFFANHDSLKFRLKSFEFFGFFSMLLYLFISFCVVVFVFVKSLDGPDSIVPLFDNAFALSTIRSYVNTGLYGPIFTSTYLDSPTLYLGSGYYPSAFHSLCALLARSSFCSPSESLNIVTFIGLWLFLSLSVRSMIKSCFPDRKAVELFGCIAPYVFIAFPWNFISFGPLFNNLFALDLVPAFLSCLIYLFQHYRGESYLRFSILALPGLTLAMIHPGAVFTAGFISVPLILSSVWKRCRKRGKSLTYSMTAAIAAFLSICFVWVVCFCLPPLQSIVSYTWYSFMSPSEAFSKILTFSFADAPAQVLVLIIVIIGVLALIRRCDSSCWLIASSLLAAIIYFVDVISDGLFKQLLAGFWYTDSRRLAVLVVLPLMPVFAYGLARIYEIARDYVVSKSDSVVSPRFAGFSVCFLLALFVFGPSLSIPGFLNIESAFSFQRSSISALNGLRGFTNFSGRYETTMLDQDELRAGNEIKRIVGDDIVFNNALDGSSFLYALNDVRVFYRSSISQKPSGVDRCLAEKINNYVSDSDVCRLIKQYRIHYVLQLDSDSAEGIPHSFDLAYKPKNWKGVQKVDASTPGFDLVYSKGDIRLYRLTEL